MMLNPLAAASVMTRRAVTPPYAAAVQQQQQTRRGVTRAAAAAAFSHHHHHHTSCLRPRLQQQQQQQQLQQQPKPSDRTTTIAAAAAAATGDGSSASSVAAAALAVVASGVANRILYRIALVPLADHTFALALFQAFGYCIVYFAILAARRAKGLVTDEMIAAAPRRRFALTGACEALAQLLLMAGASRLPGALLPLLMQTVLIWNVFFSRILLGVRPRANQLLGVLLVVAGVCAASLPPPAAAGAAAAPPALVGPNDLKPVALCVASFAFPSLAVIVKQKIFADARASLGGKELDVLVVNAFGSLAQAAFVLALLPALTAAKGLPLSALPEVIAEGARVIAGKPAFPGAPVLPGSPLFPALYLAANIAFNISALALVRATSATTASLAMAVVVPLAVLAFTLPLPLLQPAVLGGTFWAGSAVLLVGLVTYNWPPPPPPRAAKAA